MRISRRYTRNQGFTLIELMIVIAIIGVLAAIAVPNFRAARERANTRACYANQKTIAGAVEMYNLDKNTRRSDIGVASFMQSLVSGGYLQSIPNDPGQGGTATVANYAYTAGGNGIKCGIHGAIQGNS
jgi:prepilin-type N-terminal cleavage/methylation domain-containing protein